MKKAFFFALVTMMSFASVSHAQTPSPLAKGYLYTFKLVLNNTAESTAGVVEVVRKNAEDYSSLRFFQLREKIELANDNCIAVKSTLAANLLMLGTTIQLSQSALEAASEFNSDEAQVKFDKLKIYTTAASAAIDTCKSPAQSLAQLQKANAAIQEVSAYVNVLIPDLK